jgi:hypothetical protein
MAKDCLDFMGERYHTNSNEERNEPLKEEEASQGEELSPLDDKDDRKPAGKLIFLQNFFFTSKKG